MKKIEYKTGAAIVVVFIAAMALSCGNHSNKPALSLHETSSFSSYRDIPRVTENEIMKIEALREKYDHFVYSVLPSTEGFYNSDGQIRGWSALLCEWLTGLFDIPFTPRFVGWHEYLSTLASFDVDFTGHLTATPERRKIFFMTTPIAQHMIRFYRLEGSVPLEYIAQARPLRYTFITGSAGVIDPVTAALEDGTFEVLLVSDTDEAYEMLRKGEADAFFNADWAEVSFEKYGNVVARNFLPPIFDPVSLTTQNPELEPVISIIQKALDSGALRHLTQLYNQGFEEYMRYKLLQRLDPQEIEYIKNNPVIPFAAEYDNYPVSFYDTRSKEWQGIAFDILEEAEKFTGLSFKMINSQNTEWAELLRLLENGNASMISEMIRTNEREDRYLSS